MLVLSTNEITFDFELMICRGANTADILYKSICGFNRNVTMSKCQTYLKKVDYKKQNSNKKRT